MTTKCNALLVTGLLASLISAGSVWAHGNVVPQAVATPGLTPIKEAGVQLDADGWAAVNPYRTAPEHDKAVEIGASAYTQNCAACHGLEAKSGGIAPDLRMLDVGEAGDEWFAERVRHGAVRDGRVYMPKMADYLSQEALWAVRTYLDTVHVEE
ncbi:MULTISPECIES: cytochrome c-550 PedF [Pseudomonas]|jgi:cytochrome c-550 PedF|uniref:Cytochrome c-550 PedF n=1 Tax=Pseudomonas laurylsulfatiphila TaxID=2011015 RepID=A0A2S6FRX8_9PSED|nr:MULTISPECIES: cytochrome c-550 PedF [Pseudomonas]MDF9897145.1 cytochrome c-550 PedF [Pseudomonas reinekei]MBV7575009.1 cytochrome c-550 PedF [Pseudomonas sp. PDM32]MDF9906772.1 cytochrome c-550 PedF [Pseudomonas reinekei]PPK40188.1 cytochrome c-550 PedF [Pseudomonas laurylsulfatiphila]PVZ53800.1 cytochrome c-550 PedF [Pseudomonas sp. B1(2018)]